MSYYARQSYTGDGATDTFTVPFDYIAQGDVKVYVDGVEDTSVTWVNATQVQLSSTPAVAATVLIQRITQKTSRLVDYTNSSVLDEATLDKDSNQMFYIAQETLDTAQGSILLDSEDKWDAQSKKMQNLIAGVENDEAVTVGQMLPYQTACQNAQSAAETAQTNAETAETNAETAESNAVSAKVAAQTAQSNAETAETNAETAESMAEEWAEKAEDSAITGNPGKYSSYHWAQKAEDFAAAPNITGGVTDNLVSIDTDDTLKDSGKAMSNLGLINEAKEWSKQQNIDETAITSTSNATAWDTDNAQCAVHTLTENTTIAAPTNLNAGGVYTLRVVQAAGVYTLAFNSVFKWGTAETPTAPAASGDVVIFSFYSDGTNMYGVEFIREEA
jgi:hypothetical protein